MPSLTIRDVPEDILDILRERARRNHRSLNGEVLALLEASSLAPVADPHKLVEEVREIQQRYDVPTVDHAEVDDLTGSVSNRREGRKRIQEMLE